MPSYADVYGTDFAIGDRVRVDDTDLQGTITAITIYSSEYMTYQVGYIQNGVTYEPWFQSYRLKLA